VLSGERSVRGSVWGPALRRTCAGPARCGAAAYGLLLIIPAVRGALLQSRDPLTGPWTQPCAAALRWSGGAAAAGRRRLDTRSCRWPARARPSYAWEQHPGFRVAGVQDSKRRRRTFAGQSGTPAPEQQSSRAAGSAAPARAPDTGTRLARPPGTAHCRAAGLSPLCSAAPPPLSPRRAGPGAEPAAARGPATNCPVPDPQHSAAARLLRSGAPVRARCVALRRSRAGGAPGPHLPVPYLRRSDLPACICAASQVPVPHESRIHGRWAGVYRGAWRV